MNEVRKEFGLRGGGQFLQKLVLLEFNSPVRQPMMELNSQWSGSCSRERKFFFHICSTKV